ncbi:PAS domain-containing protein [Paenibacillus sp. GCM10023252]|uniref:PAS domain-containing protein n=1 Tax=Paenibacillus sp. GCM10023252 TaxID=3252649 RepID=UPI0036070AC9
MEGENVDNIFYLLADPMVVLEYDYMHWYIRDTNQAFLELTGYKKQELEATDPAGLFRDGLSFEQIMNQLTDEEDSGMEFDWMIIAKSLTSVHVRLSYRKLQTESRTYYVLICKDLTMDRWIEDYAIDHKIAMAVRISEHYRISSLTRYYAPVRHHTSKFINLPALELVAEQDRKLLRRVMEYAKVNGTLEQVQFRLRYDSNEYITSAIVKPFYRGNRSFHSFAVILTDLSLNLQEEDPSYKLRMLMLSKNMSVTSLAQSTLISLTTISKIRNGKIKKPQRLTAELIAGELGVKPESIWSSFKR